MMKKDSQICQLHSNCLLANSKQQLNQTNQVIPSKPEVRATSLLVLLASIQSEFLVHFSNILTLIMDIQPLHT